MFLITRNNKEINKKKAKLVMLIISRKLSAIANKYQIFKFSRVDNIYISLSYK